jgi:hypothetical protein
VKKAVIAGRALLALILSGGLAVTWVYLSTAPSRVSNAADEVLLVSVEPKPLRLVCPGAAVRIGGEAGTSVDLVERLGLAKLQLRNSDPAASATFEAEFTEFQTIELASQLEQSTDLLAAWQLQELNSPRIAGAAATACQSPAREHWFVAGGTQSQSDTVLLVHNPGAVESAVSVSVFGGELATSEFALAAGATEIISIATLLPNTENLAVRVQSSNPSASWLQHRTSRGLSAAGLDLVPPIAAPSELITIAGLSVRGNELAPLAQLTTPVLRVFNPSEQATEVLAQVSSSNGQFGRAERLLLNPGQLVSVVLDGLADGDYVVFITSNQPVLAGVFNPVALSLNSFDFTWLTASELFSEPFAIPAAVTETRLALANESEASLSVTVELGGSQTQLQIAARSQAVVTVPANTDVRIVPQGLVAATLQISGAGYSVVQPVEAQNLPSDFLVTLR